MLASPCFPNSHNYPCLSPQIEGTSVASGSKPVEDVKIVGCRTESGFNFAVDKADSVQ